MANEFKVTSDNRDEVLNVISDIYKEAYGIRPRHIDYSTWTNEELTGELECLSKVCQDNEDWEEMQAAAAYDEYEMAISKLIGVGAEDRPQAIKWLWDADDPMDVDHFMYNRGLLYHPDVKVLVTEVNEVLSA